MPSHTHNGVDSSLRIGLGMDSVNLTGAEGIVGNIKVYDENKVICGAGSGDGFIGDDSF